MNGHPPARRAGRWTAAASIGRFPEVLPVDTDEDVCRIEATEQWAKVCDTEAIVGLVGE
ncbi:hypothetical protein [Streptomyces malaysiensis]|uniref:hypothetical protein n=1 Tax=Streptomyces malaysiensis TaxID=92644 RepID=UPI00322035C9|nr:hypothetical protein [Streptomyces malaysiensis]